MSTAAWSWTTVIALCALAAIVLATQGYTGYSIVAGAVGLSAGVNLLRWP